MRLDLNLGPSFFTVRSFPLSEPNGWAQLIDNRNWFKSAFVSARFTVPF